MRPVHFGSAVNIHRFAFSWSASATMERVQGASRCSLSLLHRSSDTVPQAGAFMDPEIKLVYEAISPLCGIMVSVSTRSGTKLLKRVFPDEGCSSRLRENDPQTLQSVSKYYLIVLAARVSGCVCLAGQRGVNHHSSLRKVQADTQQTPSGALTTGWNWMTYLFTISQQLPILSCMI